MKNIYVLEGFVAEDSLMDWLTGKRDDPTVEILPLPENESTR